MKKYHFMIVRANGDVDLVYVKGRSYIDAAKRARIKEGDKVEFYCVHAKENYG